jgi:hypothetical protein
VPEAEIRAYAESYITTASLNMTAIVDASVRHTDKDQVVCCIANLAGGGAFLRGVGTHLELFFEELIGGLLVAARCRAAKMRRAACVKLVLVGACTCEIGRRCALDMSVVPKGLLKALLEKDIGRGALERATASFGHMELPSCVQAVEGDLLILARRVRAQRPSWGCGVLVAGDEERLGNAALCLAPYREDPKDPGSKVISVSTRDPYVGARRASEENLVRRTTALEAIIALGIAGKVESAAGRPEHKWLLDYLEDDVPHELCGDRCRLLLGRSQKRYNWTGKPARKREDGTCSGKEIDELNRRIGLLASWPCPLVCSMLTLAWYAGQAR